MTLGKKQKMLEIINGESVFKNKIGICGVFDHSVIDGANAARFMKALEGYFGNPIKTIIQ